MANEKHTGAGPDMAALMNDRLSGFDTAMGIHVVSA